MKSNSEETSEVFEPLATTTMDGWLNEDKMNEQILINRLNSLTYCDEYQATSNSDLIKNAWSSSSSNEGLATYARSSSTASSGFFSRSPSPTISLLSLDSIKSSRQQEPQMSINEAYANYYTIDFLNKNCVYAENLINKGLIESVSSEMIQKTNSELLLDSNACYDHNLGCAAINYLLFPEINECNYERRNDYENALLDILRKAVQ